MARVSVSVMTAIEDEVNHIRAKFMRIEEKMGREAAGQLFGEELLRCHLLSLNAQMQDQPLNIDDKLHVIAVAIFTLELDNDGVLTYDE